MRKPVIAIKLNVLMYAALVNLGNRVHDSLTGNGSYTTPVPALTVLASNITDVATAIEVWGPKGNRGSHADLLDLKTKAITLAQTLKSLSQYVMNTAQTTAGSDYAAMAAILSTSGYELGNAKNPQGQLQKVQAFHQFVSRKVNYNQVKFKWKRPLNVTSKSNVKNYRVLRANSTDITTAVEVGNVTRTSFTDTNTTNAVAAWTYWVIPYNGFGAGVVSDKITVAVLGT